MTIISCLIFLPLILDRNLPFALLFFSSFMRLFNMHIWMGLVRFLRFLDTFRSWACFNMGHELGLRMFSAIFLPRLMMYHLLVLLAAWTRIVASIISRIVCLILLHILIRISNSSLQRVEVLWDDRVVAWWNPGCIRIQLVARGVTLSVNHGVALPYGILLGNNVIQICWGTLGQGSFAGSPTPRISLIWGHLGEVSLMIWLLFSFARKVGVIKTRIISASEISQILSNQTLWNIHWPIASVFFPFLRCKLLFLGLIHVILGSFLNRLLMLMILHLRRGIILMSSSYDSLKIVSAHWAWWRVGISLTSMSLLSTPHPISILIVRHIDCWSVGLIWRSRKTIVVIFLTFGVYLIRLILRNRSRWIENLQTLGTSATPLLVIIIRHDCGFTNKITSLIRHVAAAIPVVLCFERICHLGNCRLRGALIIRLPRVLCVDSQRDTRVLILRLESHNFRVFVMLIILLMIVPVEHIIVSLILFIVLLLIFVTHLILRVAIIILVLIILLLLLVVAHFSSSRLGHHLVGRSLSRRRWHPIKRLWIKQDLISLRHKVGLVSLWHNSARFRLHGHSTAHSCIVHHHWVAVVHGKNMGPLVIVVSMVHLS